MRYLKDHGWVADSKDCKCMNCGAGSVSGASYEGTYPHGSLADHNFKCSCGSSWTFITEGEELYRYQFVYPREK